MFCVRFRENIKLNITNQNNKERLILFKLVDLHYLPIENFTRNEIQEEIKLLYNKKGPGFDLIDALSSSICIQRNITLAFTIYANNPYSRTWQISQLCQILSFYKSPCYYIQIAKEVISERN